MLLTVGVKPSQETLFGDFTTERALNSSVQLLLSHTNDRQTHS